MPALYGKYEAAKLRARQLRRNETPEEKIFWDLVRGRRFEGRKFYRQFQIPYDLKGRTRFFILDFYCHEVRLAVEIDGGIHKKRVDYDNQRSQILIGMGIQVLRFQNEEISELEKVRSKLLCAVNSLLDLKTPTPSLFKRGG